MKCSRGSWVFFVLVLLCFLVIPLRFAVFHFGPPSKYTNELFNKFKTQFNKTYGSPAEFQKRYDIFAKNIEDTIRKNAASKSNALFGVNRFSDLTADEFAQSQLNGKLSDVVKIRLESIKEQPQRNLSSLLNVTQFDYSFTDNNRFDRYPKFYNTSLLKKNLNFLPLRIDWRNENVLQKVRLQGTCGICWAFSVVEMMEAHLAIHHNIRRKLSVQQMVDCARNGNDGCNGGDNCLLLEWLVQQQTNIRTDEEYPIAKSGEVQTCQVSSNEIPLKDFEVYQATNFTCTSFIGNEDALLEVIANYGPVAVALNAAPWQSYVGGIIKDECEGEESNINHAVLIVGFDRSTEVPYYIIQNSWGEEFAENGFVKIAFGHNTCGIASQVSLALVK